MRSALKGLFKSSGFLAWFSEYVTCSRHDLAWGSSFASALRQGLTIAVARGQPQGAGEGGGRGASGRLKTRHSL
jgi:hypothetical protein